MNDADAPRPDEAAPHPRMLPLSDPIAAAASGIGSGVPTGSHPRTVPDQPEVQLSPNERMGMDGSPLDVAVERVAEEPPESPTHTPADGPVPLEPQPGEGVHLSTLPWDISDADDRALPPWFRRAVVLVLALAVLMRAIIWGFSELEDFWYTLFFSFFMGLAIEPLVNRLAARGLRRGLSTLIVMGGLGLGTVLFFLVFGNLLAEQLSQLIRSLPDSLDSIVAWINQRFGTSLNANSIMDSLGIASTDIAKAAANLGVGLLSILGTAVGWIFSLFTVALFTFYFAADGPMFRRAVASWMPPARQRMFLTVWDISTQKAGGYVISRGILAMISAAFHGVVFLVLDLPYWLPLAMWVGLVSQFIPTIGTYLAGALPVIIALVSGDVVTALAVLAAVTIYQQIENYLVSPRVTRNTLEIHPAVAFGSVIVGSSLFGVTGALLAIPVVATIQAIITVYGRRYTLVHEFGDLGGGSDAARTVAAVRAAEARD